MSLSPEVRSTCDIDENDGGYMLQKTQRLLTRNGLTLHGVRYYDIELFLVWCIHHDVEVEVQYDPIAISIIHVIDPSSGTRLTVNAQTMMAIRH